MANYTTLNGTHRKFLARIVGWRKVKRTDRPLSYAEALTRAGCSETIEATVCKRRLLFGGLVVRMGDERLPKLVLLGETKGGKRSVGGQERCWMRRLEENLVAFYMSDEKKGVGGKPALKTRGSGTPRSRTERGGS